MTGLTESVVDDTAIEKFKDLGYGFAYGADSHRVPPTPHEKATTG